MKPALRLLACATAVAVVAGCDESEVAHAPSFSLERMQDQPRQDPFERGMAAPPPDTVARGALSSRRPEVTFSLLSDGRSHFDVVCATCHGIRGDGDSVVAEKMLLKRPTSLLEPRVRALTDEELEEVVVRGYGLMPPYAGMLSPDERWAVVEYVRALQVAERVEVSLLPPSVAARLIRGASR